MNRRTLVTVNPGHLPFLGRMLRASVTFSGLNGGVLSSYNVSSVTRDTTGNYTLGLRSNIPTASGYGVFGHGSLRTDASANNGQLGVLQGTSPTTSAVQIDTVGNVGNVSLDFNFVGVAIYAGDYFIDTIRPDRAQRITTWGLIEGGASPALTIGKNVSSITDNGVGDYLVNFTTPYAATTYVTMCAGRQAAAIPYVSIKTLTFSTSSVELFVSDVNNTAIDTPIYFACTGE